MTRIMKVALMLFIFLGSEQAMAGGVGYSRNRLVYPAGEKAISITVSNNSDRTYLVQAGVSGNPDTRTPAPFVVTPPLFRLEQNGESVMRIVRTGGELPADRESVFYFVASTIPARSAPDGKPLPAGQTGASLSIAMRTTLKLFWRPAGFTITPEKAPGMMRFVRVADGVVVKNPTPYYQSFALLEFDGKSQDIDRQPSMVPPFGELHFPASGAVRNVTWFVMNDFGGATPKVTQAVVGN